MKTRNLMKAALVIVVALGLSACGQQRDGLSADEVEQRLSEPQGGFDMADEEPYFGLHDRFSRAELMESSVPVQDDLILEPHNANIINTPGARRYILTAVWGQPTLNLSLNRPTRWTGSVQVNRGVVWALRTVRFDMEDWLLPRPDAQTVPFRSWTLPHHDGLVLAIVDPDVPQPAIAGEVTLNFAALQQPITVGYHELDGLRRVIPVDDDGNVIILVAEALPLDPGCAAGFLRGVWHRLLPHAGFFLGEWISDNGAPFGVLLGIYGQLPNGEKVFFGKYISMLGVFRGLLIGNYENGNFGGLWFDHTGLRGVLGGIYREAIPGPETGGFFLGGWRQTICAQPDPNQP